VEYGYPTPVSRSERRAALILGANDVVSEADLLPIPLAVRRDPVSEPNRLREAMSRPATKVPSVRCDAKPMMDARGTVRRREQAAYATAAHCGIRAAPSRKPTRESKTITLRAECGRRVRISADRLAETAARRLTRDDERTAANEDGRQANG